MRRTEKAGGIGLTAILGAIGLLALGLLAWREISHGRALDEAALLNADLAGQLEQAHLKTGEAQNHAERSDAELADRQVELQSLADRVINLEAQRDHLRTESERQSERALKAEGSIEALQERLEEAQHTALVQNRLPRELESKLKLAEQQIAELENRLDGQAEELSMVPEPYWLEGISSDKTVFALKGTLPKGKALPLPVMLCKTTGVILEGWMNRIEGETIIGHVARWRQDASTLVKGEKVFILPEISHESHP